MESSRANVLIVSAVVIILAAMVNAQTICNVSISGLEACLPAAIPPTPPPPTPECCAALKDADFCCLLKYSNSSVLPSFGVDPKLAIQIPDKCHIPHPSQC